METWEAITPVHLTPKQIRDAFLWRKKNGSVWNHSPALYLPDPYRLSTQIKIAALLTPVQAHDMDGFRLVKTGEPPYTMHLCEITRTEGRIIRNESLDSQVDVGYLLVHKFLDVLSVRFSQVCQYPGFISESEHNPVAYSASLTERLLTQSLTEPKKPRLVPLLLFPPKEEIFKALGDQTPFDLDEIGQRTQLDKEKGQYHFKKIGERGELIEDWLEPSLEIATFRLVNSLFSVEWMADDRHWTFDPSSLTHRNF